MARTHLPHLASLVAAVLADGCCGGLETVETTVTSDHGGTLTAAQVQQVRDAEVDDDARCEMACLLLLDGAEDHGTYVTECSADGSDDVAGPWSPEQTEVTQADARRAGIELLQRREAIDLLIHASDLARHAPFQPDAFGLAACQLIEECAPDPRGWWLRHMDTLMVMGNARMTLAGSTPPRQWLIIEGQAAEIVRLWREGRFEDLLRGSVAVMPGGGG